jgi:hypothetical protein
MMDHAAHLRGTVNREQVGALAILTKAPTSLDRKWARLTADI